MTISLQDSASTSSLTIISKGFLPGNFFIKMIGQHSTCILTRVTYFDILKIHHTPVCQIQINIQKGVLKGII